MKIREKHSDDNWICFFQILTPRMKRRKRRNDARRRKQEPALPAEKITEEDRLRKT